MEEGDLSSLIEGLGNGSGPLLVTQQNHYVVSNTFISAEQPFPTPAPSPSIILRSPAAAVPPPSPQPPARSPAPSPARPTTPQSTLVTTQYSSIAPSSNQLVQLFPSQTNSLVGRTQIIQATTTAQTAQLKGKQPQQILPKPLGTGATAGKQTVGRMPPAISQPSAPLLINQSQPQNQTLLLNQVLTSSGPVLVQPAGASGTVHLMLRPPTPTLQSGPATQQGQMVIKGPAQQQPTVLIQQNRQQIMRIMTSQGPMHVQLQQIQTPSGPQIIAIPANQALAFPPNSVLVPAPTPMQQQQQQQHQQPQPAARVTQNVEPIKKKPVQKKPKAIKSRSDSSTSPPSSREDLSPPVVSPKVAVLASPMSSPPAPPPQKAMTSSLRQIRPTAIGRKQNIDAAKDCRGRVEEGGKPPIVDNLTATINSVAENTKSPLQEPVEDMLSGTPNLNLNKRPNLTIFQKARPDVIQTVVVDDLEKKSVKRNSAKKKGKRDENKVDLWDLMKSAGIGDEEFEESTPDIQTESLELTGADSELLAQLQGSLRLAVGEDGRPLLIDGSGVLIQDQSASCSEETSVITLKPQGNRTPVGEPPLITLTPQGTQTPPGVDAPLITLTPQGSQASSGETPVITLTPQALATAQSQLTQLLQDHGAVTAADQQLLAQIFTVNPSQGLNANHHNSGDSGIIVNSRGTETESLHASTVLQHQHPPQPPTPQLPPSPVHVEPPQVNRVEAVAEFVGAPPPGLPPLGPDSLVITNNNGVPTLVASPALLQYLQTHQGIIQFQHDPVTKTIQPSLIIPHPPPSISQPTLSYNENQIIRNDLRTSPRSTSSQPQVSKENIGGNKGVGSNTSLSNIVRNQTVASGVKMSMARIIQENPNLLQIARETSSLITYKESCSSISEAEIVEIDKKIQANKTLLDQCFHMELENLQHLDNTLIKGFQGTPSAHSPNSNNSDFQNKFLESIGMSSPQPKPAASIATGPPPSAPVVVSHQQSQQQCQSQQQQQPCQPQPQLHCQAPAQPQSHPQSSPQQVAQQPLAAQQPKKPRRKRISDMVPIAPPPQGNLTFNIKQLTPEQNERLNIALNQRGITANQVAMCEMSDVEKLIIEEEIRSVTGGALGNATVKFFPPPSSAHNTSEDRKVARFFAEEENEPQMQPQQQQQPQSAMVVNNPNLNQLLDAPTGTQLVSLGNPIHSGNQVVTLGAPPGPGSVIVGSNGNVVAIVHQAVQLTPQKQQMLKSIQAQIQAITSKMTRTQAEQTALQRLGMEQQKVLASGKIVATSPHPSQPIQIVSQQGVMPRMYQQNFTGPKPTTTTVSCGTSTADIGVGSAVPKIPSGKVGQQTILVSEAGAQYGPLYISPNTNKHVTKCEKGTSPIQIQMGTQTQNSLEYRSAKMSTGTMTSPNTGKPQAVVAPAIVHIQPPEPPPAVNTTWVKQPRICPSPVITVNRTLLIEKQLATDQAGASRPDTHTPFLSKSDAVKRLMRFHVMDERSLRQQDLCAADDMFEATSQHLLDKFRVMKDKYKYLLLMESMREVSTAERIMVDRNFIIEERMELEELRAREKRDQEEFEKLPPHLPIMAPTTLVKTDNRMMEDTEPPVLSAAESMEEDLLSPGSIGNDDRKSTPSSSLPDSGDISAQVQSAIDSILNLQQSEDPDEERRKRKRPKSGTTGSSKRGRRRDVDDEEDCASDGDPALDEAIRSILAS